MGSFADWLARQVPGSSPNFYQSQWNRPWTGAQGLQDTTLRVFSALCVVASTPFGVLVKETWPNEYSMQVGCLCFAHGLVD